MKKILEWRSGGVAKSHTVIKGEFDPNETTTEFMARAEAEFEAQLAEFPED